MIFGPNLELYIVFIEGEKFVNPTSVSGIFDGVAEDLKQDQADRHVIQLYSFEAKNAWERCREARENKSKEEADLACSEANLKNAALALVTATEMLRNPKPSVQNEWEQKASDAQQSLQDAQNAIQEAQAALPAGTADAWRRR